MDPITFSIELEIGAFLLGLVGLAATWLHKRDQSARRAMAERHHRDHLRQRERHHKERIEACCANDLRVSRLDPEGQSLPSGAVDE